MIIYIQLNLFSSRSKQNSTGVPCTIVQVLVVFVFLKVEFWGPTLKQPLTVIIIGGRT